MLAFALCIGGASGRAQTASYLYVSNFDPSSNSISGFAVDPNSGNLTPLPGFPIATPANPYRLAVSPSNKFLYLANVSTSSIPVYSIDPSTGALTQITGSPFSAGPGMSWVVLDPSGRFAYVNSSGSNSVYAYTVDANTGALTAVPGSPFVAQRTGRDEPGALAIDPAGKFLFAANYRTNTLCVFTINATTGALTQIPGSPFPTGNTPGSGTTDPSGRFFYLTNSYSNDVSAYTIDPNTGALTPIPGSPFPTGPYTGLETAYPTTIAVDRNGHYAYVTNEAAGSISIFSIDPVTGALTPIPGSPFPSPFPSSNSGPTAFTFSSDGSLAYVANQRSGSVSLYSVNSITGLLTVVPGDFPTGTQPISIAIATVPLPLNTVTPNQGGNSGNVTVTLIGAGFQAGAQVSLTAAGQASVLATNATVVSSNTLTATFDLTGAAPGAYNVVVTEPSGIVTTLPNGFTVEQGGAPQIWVDIIGPDEIRVGRTQTYYVMYGNTGNVDAGGVPVWVQVPNTVTISLGLTPGPSSGTSEGSSSSYEVPISDTTAIPLIVPVVPAGSSATLPITLSVSSAVAPFNVLTWANPPWIANLTASAAIGNPQAIKCVSDIIETGFSVEVPVLAVGIAMTNLVQSSDWKGQADAGKSFVISYAQAAGVSGMDLLGDADTAWGVYHSLIPDCAATAQQTDTTSLAISPVTAVDPNDKVGSHGAGPQQYVAGATPLRYSVYFGNQDTATAPAQQVSITDQLDTTNDILGTLSLGPITFGTQLLTPPPFQTKYSTTADLRPAINLLVAVNGNLNSSTGLLTWNFQSLDPTTMQPPTDPTVGFLPPGVGGSAFFTVMPKQGLPTNTQIQNQATIVFDVNAPISTPTWLNTLDNTPPVSIVTALPSTEASASFLVQWSGTDLGSGIGTYSVYVSTNGGPFAVWQQNTTATSAGYTGEVGHTYGFYSIATDLVGNVEPAKSSAEATTMVVQFAPAVTISPSGLTFSNQPLNTISRTRSATITNTGTGPLTITSVAASNDYAASSTCTAPINPSGSCVVNVTFTPTSVGTITGAITITDDAANSPQTLALSGTGVSGGVLNPTSLSFGNQAENTTSPPQTITLANLQNTALAITMTTSADFGQTNSCGNSIPARSACTIFVTYTPSILGAETGTLTVTDAASNSPQTASLSGRGVVQTVIAPTSLWFTPQTVGNPTAAKTVILTNNLSTALPMSITFTGANPGDFATTNSCGGSLAGRSTCTISVTFTPGGIGPRTASMNINDSAANSPQTVALTGIGQ